MNTKQYIALVLLTTISFKILVVPFVYLDFELRKEYIIQNLCENRFKPNLHCDGKCYLAKTMHKIAEDNARSETERQSQNLKKTINEVFDDNLFVSHFSNTSNLKIPPVFYFSIKQTAQFVGFVFRPPAI